MQATPWATSPNILRISDSVKRSCSRVFIKSINPPPIIRMLLYQLLWLYPSRIPSAGILHTHPFAIHKRGNQCTLQHVGVLLIVSSVSFCSPTCIPSFQPPFSLLPMLPCQEQRPAWDMRRPQYFRLEASLSLSIVQHIRARIHLHVRDALLASTFRQPSLDRYVMLAHCDKSSGW